MRSIERAGIGCCRSVDHVVQRVEAEGHVIGNPEYSVATAHHRIRIDAVRQADARSKIGFLERDVIAVAGIYEKNVAFNWTGAGRKKRHQVTCRRRIEIRHAIETFRPRTLKVVAQAEVKSELFRHVPGVFEIESPVNLLAGSECWDDRLREKVVFEIIEIIGISKQKIGKRETGPRNTG